MLFSKHGVILKQGIPIPCVVAVDQPGELGVVEDVHHFELVDHPVLEFAGAVHVLRSEIATGEPWKSYFIY